MIAAPSEDGSVPVSLERLRDGVSALTDPKLQMVGGRKQWAEPLYRSLCRSVGHTESDGYFLGVAKSQPLIWADAFDVRHDIDTTVKCWQPDPGTFDGDLTDNRPATPETVRRLRILEARSWRPQDCGTMDRYSIQLQTWCDRITHLLNPEPVKSVSAPCPACGRQWVYRQDSAGETVRHRALQLTVQGCVCQACRYEWAPKYFVHLARVLECPLPEGILE